MHSDRQIAPDACEHGIFRHQGALDGAYEPVPDSAPRELQRVRGRCVLRTNATAVLFDPKLGQLVSS